MWLHVYMVGPKERLRAVNGELLHEVNILAAAIVALAGVAFGVFVGEHRALRFQHGAGHDVFGGNQFQFVVLTPFFLPNGGVHLGVGFGQGGIAPQEKIAFCAMRGGAVRVRDVGFQQGQWRTPLSKITGRTLCADYSLPSIPHAPRLARYSNPNASLPECAPRLLVP